MSLNVSNGNTLDARHPVVLFLHITKTAGTTLYQEVGKKQYHPAHTFNISRPTFEQFQRLSKEQRDQFNFIGGHFLFGLHELLMRPAIYFTFLRNPVERIVSHYFYIHQTRGDSPPAQIVRQRNMSLEEFVQSDVVPALNNRQTKVLAGQKDVYIVWDERIEPCTRHDLERARQHIRDHFAVVGLTERFDESMLLLGQIFGWRDVLYQKRKVTTHRPAVESISSKTRALIEKYNELDMELYTEAQQQFDNLVQQQGMYFVFRKLVFQQLQKTKPVLDQASQVVAAPVSPRTRSWIKDTWLKSRWLLR